MAEESEKRFHDVMDKLFLASPPNYKSNTKSTTTTASTSASAGGLLRGRKCPLTKITTLAIVDSKFRGGTIEELRNASGGTVQSPMCRPWDREDLLKRLATFKSMTWFAKPEVLVVDGVSFDEVGRSYHGKRARGYRRLVDYRWASCSISVVKMFLSRV